MTNQVFAISNDDFTRFILATFRFDGQRVLVSMSGWHWMGAVLHEQARCPRLQFDEGIALIDGKFCHGLDGRNLDVVQHLHDTGGASAEELRLRFFKDLKRGVYKSPSTVRSAISSINRILDPHGCYLATEFGKYKIFFKKS